MRGGAKMRRDREKGRRESMLRVCCSQSEKSFNLITRQKYFHRVREVKHEAVEGGEREKPIMRTSLELLTAANYFLKTATPCSCQRVATSPRLLLSRTISKLGARYDGKVRRVSIRFRMERSFFRRFRRRASIIEQIEQAVERCRRRIEELKAAILLIKRIHACQLTSKKKKLITIQNECPN